MIGLKYKVRESFREIGLEYGVLGRWYYLSTSATHYVAPLGLATLSFGYQM
jgi:hypothetical protein